MRTPASFAGTLSLVLLLIATTASADDGPQPRDLQLELGVWGGVFRADPQHEFFDADAEAQRPLKRWSPELGVRLGFYPLWMLGVEAEVGSTFSSVRGTDENVNLFAVRGSVVFQLPARVTPFGLFGVGNFWTSSDALGDDSDTDMHLGIGAKLFLTDSVQIRVDGRLYRSEELGPNGDEQGSDVNHFGLNGALVWVIGGRQPSIAAVGDDDGDGVTDDVDQCPDVAGEAPSGCPVEAAPTDRDGDGLLDDADRCPDEAETKNGHEDADGCPDELPDGDGDGIRGDADKCPDEPEDADGFEDEDGCPDTDNDKDSLLDAADDCPSEAGPPENRGCPDKDTDGDTVVDRLDNCPDEAGTPTNQGCKAKQMVVITQTQLKILDRVYFKTNKAIIQKKSHALLDNVAEVLIRHPRITKIRVEGHTDSEGSDAMNKTLSQGRAEAVAMYLVNKGVEVERLVPVGFGEENPIADNKTKVGRAENRRVEFNIVPPEPTSTTVPQPPAP